MFNVWIVESRHTSLSCCQNVHIPFWVKICAVKEPVPNLKNYKADITFFACTVRSVTVWSEPNRAKASGRYFGGSGLGFEFSVNLQADYLVSGWGKCRQIPWKSRVLARAQFEFAQRVTLGMSNLLIPDSPCPEH